MLLKYNSDEQIGRLDWNLLEFSPDQSAEVMARRIVRKLPSLFGRRAVEMFLCPEYLAQGWIFARSMHTRLLDGLKLVHGLSVNRELCFDCDYVEQLIEKERAKFVRRISAIERGSFVWIRDGHTKDYCGTVESIAGNIAHVDVPAYAVRLLVKTPITNLEDLSFVPASQRDFFSAAIRRI